jgi:hypothetical protein
LWPVATLQHDATQAAQQATVVSEKNNFRKNSLRKNRIVSEVFTNNFSRNNFRNSGPPGKFDFFRKNGKFHKN